ncbi:hypothetical protein PXK56_18455 [Phaeobacter gallaeciensis]|uniref:hypothetical protein n=1 Tax=Phaeobacter gallaeciensis TaxID=60890 RepID=UPI00238005D1|nr:hypothetical protein [Phaeobacter gallaeciensis]MDE4297170.1 hypothetical protein [Phaeobacter gallaeciensis]
MNFIKTIFRALFEPNYSAVELLALSIAFDTFGGTSPWTAIITVAIIFVVARIIWDRMKNWAVEV